jgi:predicted phosphodiesterase
MKILIVGDLHLTDKTPANRIDSYDKTVLRKFEWILKYAKEKEVDTIIQPGDFFDTPNPSYSLFTEVVGWINAYKINILTVFGQHDLRYRNPGNTGLRALAAACPTVMINSNEKISMSGVHIQSAGWEDPVPKPSVKMFNILITHRMITKKKLWEGQEEFEDSIDFLKTHKFDLIVSGDNHQNFYDNVDDRWLINCGSMMRNSVIQVTHKPCVALFDTKNVSKSKFIDIPIESPEIVFKMEEVIKTKERDEKLESFVNGLSSHKDMGLSFEDNLSQYVQAQSIDRAIYDIIKENMNP